MKRKPDLMMVVMAVFALGVVITLLAPMTSNPTIAAPPSELQAGIILDNRWGQ